MTAKLIKATFEIETDDPTSMSALDEAMARREPVVLVGEHYSARNVAVDASDNDVEHMWRVVECKGYVRGNSHESTKFVVATLELITEAQT